MNKNNTLFKSLHISEQRSNKKTVMSAEISMKKQKIYKERIIFTFNHF